MNTLSLPGTHNTPRIYFSPEENKFEITGKSAPEDVRGLYYPVVDWMTSFVSEVREKRSFSQGNPLILRLDLDYFNSSSAKFIYDIIVSLRDLKDFGVPVIVEWYYDYDDIDMCEAGEDMASLSRVEFKFCPEEKEK